MIPEKPIIVRHFGPHVGSPRGGGIASVMSLHAVMPYRRVRPRFVTTYRFGAPLHSLQFAPGAALAVARARASSKAGVVHVHLGGGGSLVREGAIVRAASLLRLPTVVTVHASNLAETVAGDPDRVRSVLRAADVVHALGTASAAILRSVGGDDLRLELIPNPVDAPGAVSDAGQNPPTVLYAGELSWRKGMDVLDAAWPLVRAAVPDAHLVIVGEERDHPVMPGPGVDVVGPVPRTRVLELLSTARVAVLPSRRETQPMFLLEAMAAARPVVATSVAEIPSMVADGGWLVPPGDVGALADALVSVLRSPGAATDTGRAARVRVLAEHSIGHVTERFEQVYTDLVAGRRSSVRDSRRSTPAGAEAVR